MADTVEFSMTGMDEVIEKLNQLTPMVKKKGGRRALAKAASIVRAAARQNALGVDDASTREMIAKNIAMQWMARMNRQTGDLGYRIGVRGGARDMSEYGELGGEGKNNPGGDTWYWRLVEFGTWRTKANPFMRTALASNIQQATNAFAIELERQIDKVVGG